MTFKEKAIIMLRVLPFSIIAILLFAFTPDRKAQLKYIYTATGDTSLPVVPQRVYILSPHEATSIMAASLHNARELKIEDSKEGYRIVRFRITIDTGNGRPFEYMNTGSYFRPEIIWYFRNLAAKTFITIEDIELVSKTGQTNKAYPKIINAN